MAAKNRKDNSKIKIVIVAVMLLLILLLLIIITKRKKPVTPENMEKATIEYEEKRNQQIVVDLSDKSEQERMQYYCGNFFKLLDSNNYEKAYELLYSDYKENYFPILNNFKKYVKDYFPSDFGISYTNIERLGDIYVLMVTVKDTVNGSYGKNFDMYVVLKENSLNDYVLSFSRDSAVREEE